MGLSTGGYYYYTAVREFLPWINDGYRRFMDGMPTGLDSILKVTGKAKSNRNKNDLQRIFESDKYRRVSFKRASDYRVPRLALFTGARQGELCQLYVTDICEKDGIAVIDINSDEDQSLKKEGGMPRLVPLHKELVQLGFLDFV